MSSQVPPDPILTTYQYWNWVNVDEETRRQRALDNNYMMFPTAQNYPTFLSKLFLITDVALTKMANTAYVIANLVPYIASLPPLVTSTTWLALQNFTTIETNTINPVGGTLTIGSGAEHDIRIASQANRSVILHLGDGNTSSGDVFINSGENATGGVEILSGLGSTGTITLGVAGTTLSLGCPLTPTYPYPNQSGAIGVRSTAIGYIALVETIFGNNTFGPGTSGSGVSMRRADLTAGTWLLAGWVRFPSGSNLTNTNVNFSTQQNNIGGQIARKGNLTLGTSGTIPTNQRALTTTAVVFVSVTTRYYFNVCNDTAGGIVNCDMRPTRIA